MSLLVYTITSNFFKKKKSYFILERIFWFIEKHILLQAHVYNFTKNRAPLQMLMCELGEFYRITFYIIPSSVHFFTKTYGIKVIRLWGKNVETHIDKYTLHIRDNCSQMFFKIGVLKNFSHIFTDIHLWRNLFWIKLQALSTCSRLPEVIVIDIRRQSFKAN